MQTNSVNQLPFAPLVIVRIINEYVYSPKRQNTNHINAQNIRFRIYKVSASVRSNTVLK